MSRNPTQHVSALARPHVLVVSDDPDVAAFLGEGLIYAGLWTSVVASAIQALEVFRLRTFDMVIIDAGLSGIGALELVRRLRGRASREDQEARTDIPVLLLSESAPDHSEAEKAGVNRVTVAPVEITELAQSIFQDVAEWRLRHPDRPWADALGGLSRSGE